MEMIEHTMFEGSVPLLASIDYLPEAAKAGFQLVGSASASPHIDGIFALRHLRKSVMALKRCSVPRLKCMTAWDL